MEVTRTISQILVQQWVKLYRLHPRATVVTTFALLIGALITVIFIQWLTVDLDKKKFLQSRSYAEQVQVLDRTRIGVQALMEFIDGERRNLELSQRALQSLKREREQLEPLVAADRKAIDALFAAQEARNVAARSEDRWIGFGLGVLSSLAASIVWAAFAYFTRRQKPEPAA